DEPLPVGVRGAGGQGAATRDYLTAFPERHGLAGIEPEPDSGHLTRCRRDDSPLRRDNVIVAGDAAGLLEPWTREGISFALRSGALAGEIAAKACFTAMPPHPQSSQPRQDPQDPLDEYATAINQGLGEEMRASRVLMTAFTRHTG